MRPDRVLIAAATIVALSVLLPTVLSPDFPASTAPTGAPAPRTYVWSSPNYDGPIGGGLGAAVVIPIAPLPNGTSNVYVDGSFRMVSWILLTDGLFNRSGACDVSFSPAGACDLYVALWEAPAWHAYLAGEAAQPIWCYPNGAGPCLNASSGSVATPNLSSFDGAGWAITIWNVEPYELSGSYSFTVYSSTAP